MLGASYPLLDVFLTILYFFLFIIWISFLITVFIDVIGSHDIDGWAKALWVIVVIILPFLGVFVYLICGRRAIAKLFQKDWWVQGWAAFEKPDRGPKWKRFRWAVIVASWNEMSNFFVPGAKSSFSAQIASTKAANGL